LIAFSTASRVSPVRFWIRPSNSSHLPSAYWRSSSVSLAHFCFNLPLVMFQSPLISSVVVIIIPDLLFFVSIRRQHDGKSALALVPSVKATPKARAVLWGVTLPCILRCSPSQAGAAGGAAVPKRDDRWLCVLAFVTENAERSKAIHTSRSTRVAKHWFRGAFSPDRRLWEMSFSVGCR